MCAAWELGISALPKFGKFAFLEDTTPLKGNTAKVAEALLKWDGGLLLMNKVARARFTPSLAAT